MERSIELDSITHLNYNVVHLVAQKPAGYDFTPGQATEVSLSKEGWSDKKRPFTFTSLPKTDALEFVIKSYPDHNGVTERIPGLEPGDHLLIGDSWGAIEYKGKGTFIAGGAGVTPFIAILRDLADKGNIDGNKLFFANSMKKDVFFEDRFRGWLGDDFVNILSDEETEDYLYGRIDKDFLSAHISDFDQFFYVCGPPEMTEDVVANLKSLGAQADKIVTEE